MTALIFSLGDGVLQKVLTWFKEGFHFLEVSVHWILILATFSLAFITFLLFRHERRKRKESSAAADSLLDVCRIEDFDPGQIVGAYKAANTTDYLPISQDDEIAAAIRSGNDVILGGRPGIGKSHSAAHHLSAYKKWFLIKPRRLATKKLETLRLKRRRYILLLDDLNEYINDIDSLSGLLDFVDDIRGRSKSLLVLATLRTTLPEFETIQSDTKLLARWKFFELQDWTQQQGLELAKKTGVGLAAWDQTPLSVKQPSPEMELRYRLLRTESKAVLRSLKLLADYGVAGTDRKLLRSVYESHIFEGISREFDSALDEVNGNGFLKKGGEQIEAYEPYLDSIDDWLAASTDYVILRDLLFSEKRLDELLSMGNHWYQDENFTESEVVYRLCVLLNPKAEETVYRLAVVLGRLDNWSEAAAFFTKATDLRPNWSTAWYGLSQSLGALGKPEEAEKALARARASESTDSLDLRLRRAAALRSGGQPEAALAEIEVVIERNPSLVNAFYLKGRALLDLHRLDDAIEAYRQSIQLSPDLAESYFGLGVALSETGDKPGAEQAYRKAIELNPRFVRAYAFLGRVLLDLNRPQEAIQTYKQGILKRALPEAHFALGMGLLETGDNRGAEQAFKKAIELKPRFALAYSYLGRALLDLHRQEEAIEAYHQSVRLKPENPEVHFGLGVALSESGNKPAAEGAFRKAIALNPKFARAHSYLGRMLENLDRHTEAIQAYQKAISLEPNLAEAHFALGVALSRSGDKTEAELAFRKVIALQPDSPHAFSYLGRVLRDLNRPQEAIAAYREAIRLNPSLPKSHLALGIGLLDAGDNSGAEQAFRKAIELDKHFARAHSYLGRVLLRLNRPQEAVEAQRKAIVLEPEMPESHFGLGAALLDSGNLAGAEQAFRKAIELNPKFAIAYSYLGRVLHALDRKQEAIETYRQAIKLKPSLSEAYFGLGVSLSETGRKAAAEKAFRSAIETKPDFDRAHLELGRVLLSLHRKTEAIAAFKEAIRIDPEMREAHVALQLALRDNKG